MTSHVTTIAVIGAGRLGSALSRALTAAGHRVVGPLGRGADAAGAGLALLCVPDGEIAAAAASVAAGVPVGHCSGASPLALLGRDQALSLHPLMTVTGPDASFAGAGAAIAGSNPAMLALARGLAQDLGMKPVEIADADRAAYHAAASIASNFLVTLETAAERLVTAAGGSRALLAPLVRATVENWERDGAAALTGPIARGDETTVAAQRAAVADRAPELLAMFDALCELTRAIAPSRAAA